MELWIHLDCKYMPPTVASLKKDIEQWAAYGATGIVFEWENMYPYPGLGDVVRDDAYSQDDVEDIIAHCVYKGLKPIPLVQTLGHLEWLLSSNKYRHLREFEGYPQMIRACDEEGLAILENKIKALIQTHSDSPYIHLGADEAWFLHEVDRPGCSSVSEGPCRVFLRHMKPLFDLAIQHGKRPIIWADMPLRHPSNLDDFPDELIFCDWRYHQTSEHNTEGCHCWGEKMVTPQNLSDIPPEKRHLFEKYWSIGTADFPDEFYQFPYTPFLRDRGYDVVVGPSTLYAGFALAAPELPAARANEREWLRAADRFGAVGALNTCWAVRGTHREVTRVGHRAFLIQGTRINSLPGDQQISTDCWSEFSPDQAKILAELTDDLCPPVDILSCTKPLQFDNRYKTHRPADARERIDSVKDFFARLNDGNRELDRHQSAVKRAWKTAERLSAIGSENDEVRAWVLAARETAIRAEAWIAAFHAEINGRKKCPYSIPDLLRKIDEQAEKVSVFMQGKYMESDISLVTTDRYGELKKLIIQLNGAC